MRVLIVEDEPLLRAELAEVMESEDFVTDAVGRLSEAREQVAAEDYDLILLDLRLPDGDGRQLLDFLHKEEIDVPVIILTARDGVQDRINGLNSGADDYLGKPFSMMELRARIYAILRRRFKLAENTIHINRLVVHLDTPRVTFGDVEIDFTHTEYRMLRYLALNKNKTVTRISLSEHIWGDQVDNRFSLEFISSHIKNIRKKITDTGATSPIKTVYSIGYQLVPEDEEL
jgi:DNA-binding response OmpR family regulator